MNDTATNNFLWAWRLIDGLAAAGVGRVVISPGSRSTPLALAALRHPAMTSKVVVDERSAAFVALGMAKAEAKPAMLIATSGSAVANWFPAVVEADMGRTPLLLLSADRPAELQDCGANQTMNQIGLFGDHVRAFHQLPPAESESSWLAGLADRAVAASLGPLPGPVHLNIPLREPLTPVRLPELPAAGRARRRLSATLQADPESVALLEKLMAAGSGAIVCGPDDLGDAARAAIARSARRLGIPVFADFLSSLRCGIPETPAILAHPDQVARHAPAADWVLRLGGAPITSGVNDWLERCRGRPQMVVAAHPRLADPEALATHVLQADPASLLERLAGAAAPDHWLERFLGLDRAASAAAASTCADDRAFEGSLLRALLSSLPAETPIFLANSLTVRAADWFAGRTPQSLRLFGNRGVSGIDGNLSTACGIAAALGHAVAIVGDLAFLHDLNTLAAGRDCRVTVVLVDNGGGGIFDHLAQASLPEFERGWLTPQFFDPVPAAQAFGLSCIRAEGVRETVAAVRAVLGAPRMHIIHVPVDRAFSLARIREFHSANVHECLTPQLIKAAVCPPLPQPLSPEGRGELRESLRDFHINKELQ